MEDGNLVVWVVGAAAALLILLPALRHVSAARAEHRARLELRAYGPPCRAPSLQP
jgi:cytidylate kinase